MILNKNAAALSVAIVALMVGLAVTACGFGAPPTATPNIPATVQAEVAAAMPTETATP